MEMEMLVLMLLALSHYLQFCMPSIQLIQLFSRHNAQTMVERQTFILTQFVYSCINEIKIGDQDTQRKDANQPDINK